MNGKLLMIFLLEIFNAESIEKLLFVKEEINASLTECLLTVIQKLTKNSPKILLQTSKQNDGIVTEILKKLEVPVMINVMEDRKPSGLDVRIPTSVAVILNEDLQAFEILNGTLWIAETRFLLVYEHENDMEELFQQFWSQKVVNVFVFVTQGADVVAYGFTPYENEDCEAGNPKVIDTWKSNRFLKNLTEITKKIRIQNMNSCNVNISVVDVKPQVMFNDEDASRGIRNLDGTEARIMNEIARQLNFSTIYFPPLDGVGWGWIYPKPGGVVGEVYTGRSDFGFGLLAPTIERYENLDISVPYTDLECITYGVPRGALPKLPKWITILTSEFPPLMWFLIAFAFVSVVLHFRFVGISSHEVMHNVISFAFGTCLGVPVKHPITSVLRFTFISWVWFTFVITLAYQTSMGSKLTVPEIDRDINTFKELLSSKLTLTGYYNMKKVIEGNEQTEIFKEMTKRFKVTDYDIDYAVDLIASERRIAHVRHETTFLYYALVNPKAKGQIHMIEDCIYIYFPTFVTKKNSPFTNSVNEIITRLRESGITNYWRSFFIYEVPPIPQGFVKLSLYHMFGLFFIYGLGTLMSIVTFITELIHYCFINGPFRKKKKRDEIDNKDKIVT